MSDNAIFRDSIGGHTGSGPGLGESLSTRAQPMRKSIMSGRFARWYQDTDVPVEEEGWLLTYLDTMTLLLVMMVVMLIFSEPIKKDQPPEATSTTVSAEGAAAETTVEDNAQSAASDELDQLPLDQLGTGVEVIQEPGSVRFRISSELLFPSGEAGLTAPGLAVLDSLLPALQVAGQHQIVVEGHTDNVPINTLRYPSNWELAAGRAGSVVRHLQSRGIAAGRMRATGYADTHPIAPNTSAVGQAANRRVELSLELPKSQ